MTASAGFHLAGKSAFAEFEKFGHKCDVSGHAWELVSHTALKPDRNTWGDNFKTIQVGRLKAVEGLILKPVSPNALTMMHETLLKG